MHRHVLVLISFSIGCGGSSGASYALTDTPETIAIVQDDAGAGLDAAGSVDAAHHDAGAGADAATLEDADAGHPPPPPPPPPPPVDAGPPPPTTCGGGDSIPVAWVPGGNFARGDGTGMPCAPCAPFAWWSQQNAHTPLFTGDPGIVQLNPGQATANHGSYVCAEKPSCVSISDPNIAGNTVCPLEQDGGSYPPPSPTCSSEGVGVWQCP